jgi:DNA-binding XRE family transcriptional regulator
MTANQLRDWRQEHGLSRKELAEILGVHWMTVTAWEVGKQDPPKYLSFALRGIEVEIFTEKAPTKLKIVS